MGVAKISLLLLLGTIILATGVGSLFPPTSKVYLLAKRVVSAAVGVGLVLVSLKVFGIALGTILR